MSKIKYCELPAKVKLIIDEIIKIRTNNTQNKIMETNLSFLVWFNIGISKNFDTAFSIKNWVDIITDYNLLSPAIEEELFPLIFSSPSE